MLPRLVSNSQVQTILLSQPFQVTEITGMCHGAQFINTICLQMEWHIQIFVVVVICPFVDSVALIECLLQCADTMPGAGVEEGIKIMVIITTIS